MKLINDKNLFSGNVEASGEGLAGFDCPPLQTETASRFHAYFNGFGRDKFSFFFTPIKEKGRLQHFLLTLN